MVEIHKKILPEYFDALASGEKKYELRLADEDFADMKVGDVLVLEEWTGLGSERKPTGRSMKKTISHTHHFTLDELSKFWPREEIEEKGLLIMSLEDHG
jgi:ASC-1-like (ASCH) protein